MLDVTQEHCQCEWYFVNTLYQRNGTANLAKVLKTQSSDNHLQPSGASYPCIPVPALAPAGEPQKV